MPQLPQSGAIREIAYKAETKRLVITFVTGRVYEYLDVPAGIAACFGGAQEKCAFFNRHIREHYDFHEITRAH